MKASDLPIPPPSMAIAIIFVVPGVFLILAAIYMGIKAMSVPETGMLRSLFLLISGLALGGYGVCSYHYKRKKFLLYETNKWQPWNIYSGWQTFSIKSQQLKQIFAKIPAVVFFMIFSLGFFYFLVFAKESFKWYYKMFCGLWFLTTFHLLFELILATYRRLKYGESELILAQKPLIPGQNTDIYVILPQNIKQGTFKIKIYLEELWKGIDAPQEKILFENNYSVQRAPSDMYQGKPFIKASLSLPKDAKESFFEGTHLFEWRVQVSAPASQGIGFETEFLVPVFNVKNEKLIEHNPLKIKS